VTVSHDAIPDPDGGSLPEKATLSGLLNQLLKSGCRVGAPDVTVGGVLSILIVGFDDALPSGPLTTHVCELLIPSCVNVNVSQP
jgi:hypothetical protein